MGQRDVSKERNHYHWDGKKETNRKNNDENNHHRDNREKDRADTTYHKDNNNRNEESLGTGDRVRNDKDRQITEKENNDKQRHGGNDEPRECYCNIHGNNHSTECCNHPCKNCGLLGHAGFENCHLLGGEHPCFKCGKRHSGNHTGPDVTPVFEVDTDKRIVVYTMVAHRLGRLPDGTSHIDYVTTSPTTVTAKTTTTNSSTLVLLQKTPAVSPQVTASPPAPLRQAPLRQAL